MIHFLQLLILLSGYPSSAQPPRSSAQPLPPTLITIKGIVLDSSTSNRPIGLVTLTLTDNSTGETVRSSVTKNDGAFELSAPANHSYNLSLTSVGYLPKNIPVPGADTTQDAPHPIPMLRTRNRSIRQPHA